MFKTETMAYRGNIFLGFNSSTDLAAKVATPVTLPQLKTTKTSFEISLQPGFENHMAGTDRLSPYWGAILDIGFKTSSEKKEHSPGVTTAGGLADSVKVETTTTTGKDGFFRIGAGLVLGTDFYFAKKFYVGAECGVGLSYKMMSTIKVTETEVDKPAAPATADQKQGSEFNFGPTVNAKLRLGWNF
jgi:hypothetical protein